MPKLRLCTSSLPPPPSNSPSVLAYPVPKFSFPTHSPTMSRLWVLLSSSFPFNFPLLPLLCRLFHCWVDSTLNSIPTTNMWRGSLVPNSVDNVLHAFFFFVLLGVLVTFIGALKTQFSAWLRVNDTAWNRGTIFACPYVSVSVSLDF